MEVCTQASQQLQGCWQHSYNILQHTHAEPIQAYHNALLPYNERSMWTWSTIGNTKAGKTGTAALKPGCMLLAELKCLESCSRLFHAVLCLSHPGTHPRLWLRRCKCTHWNEQTQSRRT